MSSNQDLLKMPYIPKSLHQYQHKRNKVTILTYNLLSQSMDNRKKISNKPPTLLIKNIAKLRTIKKVFSKLLSKRKFNHLLFNKLKKK